MNTEFDFANSNPENLVGTTPGWNVWIHLSTIIFTFGNNQMTGRIRLCLSLMRPLIKREGAYF